LSDVELSLDVSIEVEELPTDADAVLDAEEVEEVVACAGIARVRASIDMTRNEE
jgi:hypothetical protein